MLKDTVKAQSIIPKIECLRGNASAGDVIGENYCTFETSINPIQPKGYIQSWNYTKSLNDTVGDFSFTVIENNKIITLKKFLDQIQPLDIIKIYEDGSEQFPDFMGVVTRISFGANANDGKKLITITGRSIEYLFEMLFINGDVKSEILNPGKWAEWFKTDLGKNESLPIEEVLNQAYNGFRNMLLKARDEAHISNTSNVIDIIDRFYAKPKFEIDPELSAFLYPITSTPFTNTKVSFLDYIRQLLPQPIYEIYGEINTIGLPVLKIRKVPFSVAKLAAMQAYKLKPTVVTDFTLTRSCEEVYTQFMVYLENSNADPKTQENLQFITRGYTGCKNTEKANLYGFRLMTVTYIGFNPNNINSSVREETNNTIQGKLNEMNQELSDFYSDLDDYYIGDITFAKVKENKLTKIGSYSIGNWIDYSGGQFYVVSEKHSWSFGDPVKINLQLDRGGEYINGIFTKLIELSKVYSELTKYKGV